MKLFRAGRDLSQWMTRKLLAASSLSIGTITWRPPPWSYRLRSLCNGVSGWLLVAALASLAAFQGVKAWKAMQPVPDVVTALVYRPALPLLSEILQPRPPVILEFSKAAAMLDSIGRPAQGIGLTPKMEGRWKWSSDRRLIFEPASHWPADTEYTITLPETALIKDLPLDRHEFRFRTPAFQASIQSLEIKIDPRNEERREILATVEFTHPVDAEVVRKAITAETIGGAPLFNGEDRSHEISVKLARQNRLAFINAGTVSLPERDDFVKLTLPKDLRTLAGGAPLKSEVASTVKVASPENFFQIQSIDSRTVYNDEGVPEQIVIVKTTGEAKTGSLNNYISARLLTPPPAPENEEAQETSEDACLPVPEPRGWGSLANIPRDVLDKGSKLELLPLPTEHELGTLHSYRVSLPTGGNLAVSVKAGARGYGGYTLKEEYSGYLYLSGVPAEIEILGQGSVLALPGEKKISLKTRRLQTIRVQICRIFPDELNHLVSQTGGDFGHPEFENWNFQEENISIIGERFLNANGANDAEARYVNFDFKDELAKVEPRLSGGLFVLRMSGWDDTLKRAIGTRVRRFVLVTDLGIIAKKSEDGSRAVYVQSLAAGAPSEGVTVEVLSKNGQILVSSVTDSEGCAKIESVSGLKREKEPVAIVVRKESDIAFLPFDREDRVVDVSNFDTGGITLPTPSDLQAFGFTERGVYRPGDTVRLGMLLKRRDWEPLPEGLPVTLEIFDSRGKSVFLEKRPLQPLSMLEYAFDTSAVSPTGTYQFELFAGDGIKERNSLFTGSFRVEDFQPDRMKLEASLAPVMKKGWMRAEDLEVNAHLQHLFGAPAADCEVKGTIICARWTPAFPEYAGWTFYQPEFKDRFPSDWKEEFSTSTDSNGDAMAKPALSGLPDTGLTVTADIKGYEPDGGRSVATRKSVPVASFDQILGWRCSQDLDFLTKDLACELEVLALDPDLQSIPLENIGCKIISIQQISALIQDESGTYRYRSVPREIVVRESTLNLQEGGNRISLPTTEAGDFRIELAERGALLLKRSYHVAGKGNPSAGLEKSAEMECVLSQSKPQPGETITLSLKTPYTGSGLITIEREHVITHQWFKTDTTSSVQSIRIPDDFEGTGYIVVSMLRSLDSEEIFASPHTHSVVPFEVLPQRRKLELSLSAAEKVKPGEKLKIGIKTNRPCKAIIFAVDEGILQVSDYTTPDPLAAFFEKRALLVETSQILDQLLPEYSLLAKQSAFGGDGEEKLARNLNPFTRVTEKPVVYWSGIIDVPKEGSCTYEVPDYFDGALRLMAVALAQDGSDSTELAARVTGPFVLQPTAPLAAPPGDEMIATVHVTRLADDFPADSSIEVLCDTGEQLKVLDARRQSLVLAPGEGKVVTFRIRVEDKLGSAELRFSASGGGHNSTRKRTLSIRPIVPYTTLVRSGRFEKSASIHLKTSYRPEFLKRKAVLSRTPLSVAVGLSEYLAEFPHGCTEQTTSKAFCRLLLSSEQSFGLTRDEAARHVAAAIRILRARQSNGGTFGLWEAPLDEPAVDWLSCYVTDFLIEAKSAGFEVPEDLLTRANAHLDKVAGAEAYNLEDARAVSYAIYLLTRQGNVTTNLLLHLRDNLARSNDNNWRADITALYVAGTHALLLQRNEAKTVFEGYIRGGGKATHSFFNRLVGQSLCVTLLARHSPELLKTDGEKILGNALDEIENARFNTISGAYAVQALRAYSGHAALTTTSLSVQGWNAANKPVRMSFGGGAIQQGVLPAEVKRLAFEVESSYPGSAYYQVVESGFVREPKPYQNGIEVTRLLSIGPAENPATIALGQNLRVTIRIRSTSGKIHENVAIIDLLPAGFELVPGQVRPGGGSHGFDYVDVREDRILFYGTIGGYQEITYQLTPIARGRFQVPPVTASSMYDLGVGAMSAVKQIEVVEAK